MTILKINSMGKIIYEAKGKAQEYGKYGVSTYIGCSNGCKYCYLKTGRFKNIRNT